MINLVSAVDHRFFSCLSFSFTTVNLSASQNFTGFLLNIDDFFLKSLVHACRGHSFCWKLFCPVSASDPCWYVMSILRHLLPNRVSERDEVWVEHRFGRHRHNLRESLVHCTLPPLTWLMSAVCNSRLILF